MPLPRRGNVYIDANTIIYLVERIPPYDALLRPLWVDADNGRLLLHTSELSILECLVKPLREADALAEGAFRATLFRFPGLLLHPISVPVLSRSASLRATTVSLKTPDAIHAATAAIAGCDHFVTNDDRFRRIPNFPVIYLGDLVP